GPRLNGRRSILGEGSGSGAAGYAREVRQSAEQRRERALCRMVEGAVLLLETTTADADPRLSLHQLDELTEGLRRQARVGIERQDEPTPPAPEREVGSCGEAEVSLGVDKRKSRELALDLLVSAAMRRV